MDGAVFPSLEYASYPSFVTDNISFHEDPADWSDDLWLGLAPFSSLAGDLTNNAPISFVHWSGLDGVTLEPYQPWKQCVVLMVRG